MYRPTRRPSPRVSSPEILSWALVLLCCGCGSAPADPAGSELPPECQAPGVTCTARGVPIAAESTSEGSADEAAADPGAGDPAPDGDAIEAPGAGVSSSTEQVTASLSLSVGADAGADPEGDDPEGVSEPPVPDPPAAETPPPASDDDEDDDDEDDD